MAKKINKAVIPVAGFGTRMLPVTKAIPKELLPVYDRPIIDHVVQEAIEGGITEIILVTRSGKEAIENHFDTHYELEHRLDKTSNETVVGSIKEMLPDFVKITSVRQHVALGLGHALLCAKHLLNHEPFAVLLPDVLVLDQLSRAKSYSFARLMQAWMELGRGQIMVERVDTDAVENYGIVDLKGEANTPFSSLKVKGLVEKPTPQKAPSNLAIVGRYVLPFKVIELLEHTAPGVDGEIQLTDALDQLLESQGLNAVETDAQIFDCGNKQGFLSANLAVGMRDPETKRAIKTLFDASDC